MRAVEYSRTGGPEVLRLVERDVPEPGPGEVRVAVRVSGVNPTDWKARRGRTPGEELAFPKIVPNQDGAGTIDAVGESVAPERVGERVWLWEAAWERANGTAQEYVVLPERQAVTLPEGVSFDVGASLGIPALTAHRCLTLSDLGPRRLEPGALAGRNVLDAFVLVYTVPTSAKKEAVADVAGAAAEGALPVGGEAGLPLHRFALEQTGDAHAAVEGGAVGKVLIDVAD